MPGIQLVLNKYLLNEWLNSSNICYRSAQGIEAQEGIKHTLDDDQGRLPGGGNP